MKINAGMRSMQRNPLTTLPSAQHAGQKSFADYMAQQASANSVEQLKEMMKQIESIGTRLTRTMTVRDLLEYKQLVKHLIDAAIRQGIAVKETRGFNRHGRGKRYMIVEEVDRQLLALTDQLLLDESGRLELLQRIGEIRGLLINLLS